MKLFIVLVCIVAITVADHGKGKGGKAGEKSSKNPICSKKLSVKPSDCCPNMPSFKQFFDTCAAQCNATLATTEAPTTSASKASGKRGKGERGDRHGKESGKGQFFKCVMPCVLQAANVLGADGNISGDALNAALLKGADANWTQIVPPVTSACIANATAMISQPKKSDKSSEEKNSTSARNGTCFNGKVMKCVFKNLYLSCPSAILVNSSNCTDLTTKMSQCPCEHGKNGKNGGSGEKGEKQSGEKGGKSGEKGGKGGEKRGKGGKGEKNGKKESKKEGKEGRGRGKTTQAPATEAPAPTAQAVGK